MSYNALNPPPLVKDKPANEVMRIAVHNGELHLSLRRGFNDPAAWGLLFVDAARHVARIYATEDKFREEETMERIRALYDAEMDAPTDPGTTSALS